MGWKRNETVTRPSFRSPRTSRSATDGRDGAQLETPVFTPAGKTNVCPALSLTIASTLRLDRAARPLLFRTYRAKTSSVSTQMAGLAPRLALGRQKAQTPGPPSANDSLPFTTPGAP